MAIHPHLLKSICFYLMPQLFPNALFFTLNTNLSIHLFFSPPFCLQAEWLLPPPSLYLPTEHVSCFSPLALGSLSHRKFWLCFSFSLFLLFFFFTSPGTKGETFNSYWFGDIQLLLEIPFNHKSWFIVGPLTIPLNCCLANQVYSFSWRTNLLWGQQNKSRQ